MPWQAVTFLCGFIRAGVGACNFHNLDRFITGRQLLLILIFVLSCLVFKSIAVCMGRKGGLYLHVFFFLNQIPFQWNVLHVKQYCVLSTDDRISPVLYLACSVITVFSRFMPVQEHVTSKLLHPTLHVWIGLLRADVNIMIPPCGCKPEFVTTQIRLTWWFNSFMRLDQQPLCERSWMHTDDWQGCRRVSIVNSVHFLFVFFLHVTLKRW